MQRTLTLLVWLVFTPSLLFSNTVYFPQVAYGGGYATTFTILNTGTADVVARLILYSQGGEVVNVPLNIPLGGSSRFTHSSASESVSVGWAVVTTTAGTVQGVATFDLRSVNGPVVSTAGILGVEAANSYFLPVDVTSSSSTGLAVANISSTASASVRLRLLSEDGGQIAVANDVRLNPLGARQHVADFITTFFPQVARTNLRGTLVVETAAASTLAATALTLKDGLLSALPVIPIGIPTTTSVLYSQPADFPGTYSSIRSQNTVQAFDNFAIPAGGSIVRAAWQGLYVANDTTAFRPAPAPAATSFFVAFYADNAGSPGTLLGSNTYAAREVNETLIAYHNEFRFTGAPSDVPTQAAIYSYSLALSAPVAASPGTRYWISIRANTPTNDVIWGWNSGSLGDGTSQRTVNNQTTVIQADRAFSLR